MIASIFVHRIVYTRNSRKFTKRKQQNMVVRINTHTHIKYLQDTHIHTYKMQSLLNWMHCRQILKSVSLKMVILLNANDYPRVSGCECEMSLDATKRERENLWTSSDAYLFLESIIKILHTTKLNKNINRMYKNIYKNECFAKTKQNKKLSNKKYS